MVNPEIVERVLKEFYVGEATTPSKYQIPLSISVQITPCPFLLTFSFWFKGSHPLHLKKMDSSRFLKNAQRQY